MTLYDGSPFNDDGSIRPYDEAVNMRKCVVVKGGIDIGKNIPQLALTRTTVWPMGRPEKEGETALAARERLAKDKAEEKAAVKAIKDINIQQYRRDLAADDEIDYRADDNRLTANMVNFLDMYDIHQNEIE